MIQRSDLIDQARDWVGVRFVHQGRTRNGCDCLGFIAAMLAELGSSVFLDYLPRNYAREPQALLMQGLEELTREIPLQPGALVAIEFPGGKWPSHGGIYTGDSIIHSYQSAGKVIEHGYRRPWPQRTQSIWALPLVIYQ